MDSFGKDSNLVCQFLFRCLSYCYNCRYIQWLVSILQLLDNGRKILWARSFAKSSGTNSRGFFFWMRSLQSFVLMAKSCFNNRKRIVTKSVVYLSHGCGSCQSSAWYAGNYCIRKVKPFFYSFYCFLFTSPPIFLFVLLFF